MEGSGAPPPITSMTEYPEHEKMHLVKDDADTVAAFLEWMQEEGWVVAKWRPKRACEYKCGDRECHGGMLYEFYDGDDTGEYTGECPRCEGEGVIDEDCDLLTPVGLGIEKILARYLDIDLQKISEEKDLMLREIRAHHD